MTRVFYDWEFFEDGRTIKPISIGMVTDDGREYYAVNAAAPMDQIRHHEWLMSNVVPHLPLTPASQAPLERYLSNSLANHREAYNIELDVTRPNVKEPGEIAEDVRDFIRAAGPDVELWAWYGAYDHVALCQLWGPMIDLPDGVPMWTNDLRQERHRLGNPEMPRQAAGEHNALDDARHNLAMARFLDAYEERTAAGPMRWSRAGWEIALDSQMGRPPHVAFKRHDMTVVEGYVHPDPPRSNFDTAPGLVVTMDDSKSP